VKDDVIVEDFASNGGNSVSVKTAVRLVADCVFKIPFVDNVNKMSDLCMLVCCLGGLFSYFTGLFGSRERRILILGLDGAGKTTILYRLQVGEVVTTIPSAFCSDTSNCIFPLCRSSGGIE